MKTETKKTKTAFKYDADALKPKKLVILRKAILQYGPTTREVAAQIVRGHGFEAYVGGHHVAVMTPSFRPGQFIRLALITSNAPDFN